MDTPLSEWDRDRLNLLKWTWQFRAMGFAHAQAEALARLRARHARGAWDGPADRAAPRSLAAQPVAPHVSVVELGPGSMSPTLLPLCLGCGATTDGRHFCDGCRAQGRPRPGRLSWPPKTE